MMSLTAAHNQVEKHYPTPTEVGKVEDVTKVARLRIRRPSVGPQPIGRLSQNGSLCVWPGCPRVGIAALLHPCPPAKHTPVGPSVLSPRGTEPGRLQGLPSAEARRGRLRARGRM